jgi:hypothetical protein
MGKSMTTDSSFHTEALLPFTLRSIYLRHSAVRMDEKFDPLIPGQPLNPVFRTGEVRVDCRETKFLESDKETVVKSCAFTVRFDFAYARPAVSGEPISDDDIEKLIAAQITADITVDYLFNLPALPDEDAMKAWASGNVVLHSWPYWREFCHSTMLRMNLPVTMIPLIQLANQQEPTSKQPALREAKPSNGNANSTAIGEAEKRTRSVARSLRKAPLRKKAAE